MRLEVSKWYTAEDALDEGLPSSVFEDPNLVVRESDKGKEYWGGGLIVSMNHTRRVVDPLEILTEDFNLPIETAIEYSLQNPDLITTIRDGDMPVDVMKLSDFYIILQERGLAPGRPVRHELFEKERKKANLIHQPNIINYIMRRANHKVMSRTEEERHTRAILGAQNLAISLAAMYSDFYKGLLQAVSYVRAGEVASTAVFQDDIATVLSVEKAAERGMKAIDELNDMKHHQSANERMLQEMFFDIEILRDDLEERLTEGYETIAEEARKTFKAPLLNALVDRARNQMSALPKTPPRSQVAIQRYRSLFGDRLYEDVVRDGANLELAVRARDDLSREFVESNLRLAISIASRYQNRGLDFEDLIQEAYLGLIKGVDRFDPGRGFKFSSYATWWIKQNVRRAIDDYSTNIRLPVHMRYNKGKFLRAKGKLIQELGRQPTVKELSLELSLKPETVEILIADVEKTVSLNAPIGSDGDTELGDLLDVGVNHTEEATRQAVLERTFEAIFADAKLTDREVDVVRLRYGFEGSPLTLEEVGLKYKLTRERIRQIENKALNKLRHHNRLFASSKARSIIDGSFWDENKIEQLMSVDPVSQPRISYRSSGTIGIEGLKPRKNGKKPNNKKVKSKK